MKRWISKIHSIIIRPRVAISAVLCCIALLSYVAVSEFTKPSNTDHCETIFSLLNPRRRCEKDEPPKKQEYDLLIKTLKWRIEEWKKNGDASHITVYFRDLQNGPIFGISELEHFAPASLLKVPILIAVLKYAEEYPQVLQEKIGLSDAIPKGQNEFDPRKTLEPRKTYSIEEVLRRMIVYSDNSSKELLRNYLEGISPGIIDQTFIDLGISLQNADGSQYIRVKSYASLFRALFNASYLNREMSQKALDLLAQAEFEDGVVAGVPKGILVAHKFGFLDIAENQRQLHDCGIIYEPKTPYLLCVMTRGKDAPTLMSIISKISEAVYAEVSIRNKEM